MKRIRASSLPRIMSCPASLRAPEVEIDTSDDMSNLGTAAHEVLADGITEGFEVAFNIGYYANKHAVKEDDLSFLVRRGVHIWNTLKPALIPDSVTCEHKFLSPINPEYELSGHVDVCAEMATGSGLSTLVIIDWKSGFVERDYRAQLMAYAWLANNALIQTSGNGMPFDEFKIVTAWLRTGEWEVLDLTLADLGEFINRLDETLSAKKEIYSPSDSKCLYCPLMHECRARARLVQSAIMSLVPLDTQQSNVLTDREKLASVFEKAHILGRALEQYRDALRATIRNEGPLPLPDGRWLSVQTQTRDKVYFTRASAEIIAPYLDTTPDCESVIEILGPGVVTINKKAMLDGAAYAKAGEMTRRDVTKNLMTELIEAGSVHTKAFDKIVPSNKKPLIEKEIG